MRWSILGLLMSSVACGGASERTSQDTATGGRAQPDAVSQAGGGNSSGVAGTNHAGTGSSFGGAVSGSSGGGGFSPSGGAGSNTSGAGGQAAAELVRPRACDVGIATTALAGCRAPNEPGCATCSVPDPPHDCRVFSGGEDRGGFSVYTEVTYQPTCPSGAPQCATCSEESELRLCSETTRLECDCNKDWGIDPCFLNADPLGEPDCGCWCQQFGAYRKACPPQN